MPYLVQEERASLGAPIAKGLALGALAAAFAIAAGSTILRNEKDAAICREMMEDRSFERHTVAGRFSVNANGHTLHCFLDDGVATRRILSAAPPPAR